MRYERSQKCFCLLRAEAGLWPSRKITAQALIGNAIWQASYVRLCHMLSSVLIVSTGPSYTKKKLDERELHGMLFMRLMHSAVLCGPSGSEI